MMLTCQSQFGWIDKEGVLHHESGDTTNVLTKRLSKHQRLLFMICIAGGAQVQPGAGSLSVHVPGGHSRVQRLTDHRFLS